jgi:hypothetical protein
VRPISLSILAGTAIALIALSGRGDRCPAAQATAAGPVTAEQLRASAKNLERIALAVHNYHDAHGTLPTNLLAKDKKPLLSWRVQVLEYMEPEVRVLTPPDVPPDVEYAELFRAFRRDEPWDSEHNKKLIAKIPRVYAPVRGKAAAGTTFYQAFGGTKGWLRPGARLAASFPDGTSNTFLAAEAAEPVVWTRPDDLAFDGKAVPALGGLFDGRFHAARADGSVSLFRKGVDPATLRLWIDPADGVPFPEDTGLDPGEKK